MIPLSEAKEKVLDRYGFTVVEEPDLGRMEQGDLIKGEAHAPNKIVIRSSLDDIMKIIAISHEAGHLIDYSQNKGGYLHGSAIKDETKAWLNGLPLAIEMDILNEYIDYWKMHLEKLK